MSTFTVAVIQASSVLFNLPQTLAKAEDLVNQAANQGAKLVLFPEAFISAYPRGLGFGTVVGSRTDAGRALWQQYWDSSIAEGDSSCLRLGQMAKNAGLFLAIGVNEKDTVSGTLFCSIFYFSPQGELIGKHRKIKPTAQERVIWGEDDGSTLSTFDTELGKLGGLICWENYMPMARMAMYQKGVQVYLAPTADSRESWQATMKHIALEGRCYVLGSNQYVTKSMYPKEFEDELKMQPEVMCQGGSVILDPLGNVLAGPLWGEEGMLTVEINLEKVTQAKLDFDPIGHYNRADLFNLTVKNQPPIKSVE